MKTVTVGFLRSLGACEEQLELFEELFPTGALVTEENAVEAIAGGMNVEWLLGKLPPAILAEYKRIEGPVWAEYRRIEEQAWAEYKRIQGPAALIEYRRIQGAALAEYERIQGSALAAALLALPEGFGE